MAESLRGAWIILICTGVGVLAVLRDFQRIGSIKSDYDEFHGQRREWNGMGLGEKKRKGLGSWFVLILFLFAHKHGRFNGWK